MYTLDYYLTIGSDYFLAIVIFIYQITFKNSIYKYLRLFNELILNVGMESGTE